MKAERKKYVFSVTGSGLSREGPAKAVMFLLWVPWSSADGLNTGCSGQDGDH